ncbi:MAG: high-potential iron-sulfur protein [Polyangiales bacterium]
MAENNVHSRRTWIKATVSLPVLAGSSAWLLSGCGESKKELSCTDTSSVSATDLQLRTAQQYADKSPHADKNCANCNFYEAGAPDACGTCKVIKGPINPAGYCNAYAKKA